jgi:spermidine/putrescine transport system permease protein
MSEAAVQSRPVALPRSRPRGVRGWWKDPWRRPRLLEMLTWGYLVWSILPVFIAIAISFNAGRSNTNIQSFGLRWWIHDPDQGSLFQDSSLRRAMLQTYILSFTTMIVAVPLGVAFAIGIDRWHTRPARSANFLMLLTFVMPEIIIGVAMQQVFVHLLSFVKFGTIAQLLGLVTYQISYPVIIVRARLLSIGREYEEAGMDLGATPRQSIKRVLLPLLYPAIFASYAIVFADTVDDFVTVRYLSGPSTSEPLAVKIYQNARAGPTPALNAAVTFMLVTTTAMIALGYLAYKRFSRGQEGGGVADFTQQL